MNSMNCRFGIPVPHIGEQKYQTEFYLPAWRERFLIENRKSKTWSVATDAKNTMEKSKLEENTCSKKSVKAENFCDIFNILRFLKGDNLRHYAIIVFFGFLYVCLLVFANHRA